MAGLSLYTSNRLEALADALAGVVSRPLRSPLEPEIVVVQSRGMERWLSMQLARRIGVWANCRYPFPNAFVHELFRALLPDDIPEVSPYDPSTLAWQVFEFFQQLPAEAAFDQLRTYIPEGNQLRGFQLALKVADLFDQYTVFRPDMVASWDGGADEHWQARLWRELLRRNGPNHRATLHRKLVDVLRGGPVSPVVPPQRVAVFGISALAPYHVELLQAISTTTEVNLFLLNPCAEFWDDIVTERQADRVARRERGSVARPPGRDQLHLEEGNALLAALGAYGRDFLALLHDADAHDVSSFVDPGATTLLACIQSDILHLQRPVEAAVSATDRSVQVNSCHSAMREVEVLYDNLLACFEQMPGLDPSDIVVMTPDIESYAPYIEAVFGSPEDAQVRIPYSLADRSLKDGNTIASTLITILGMPGSRFGASEVLALLENTAVQAAFGFTETDIPLVQRWVSEAGVRWGIDRQTAEGLGLPPIDQNTWKSGLDRLLLGYALPGFGRRQFAGITGYDQIEGNLGETLGKLVEFADTLFSTVRQLETPRPLSGWSELLVSLLDRFFLPDQEMEQELAAVRLSVLSLARAGDLAQYSRAVALDVVAAFLKARLGDRGSAPGFITGSVTFCAMMPMRSIPFRVVCLLGMDDGAFPRRAPALSWDLMAANPKKGDRSLHKEDRYIFLEALLSARDVFCVSYVGQSIRDNTPRQPSILVNELLDYIEHNYQIGNVLSLVHSSARGADEGCVDCDGGQAEPAVADPGTEPSDAPEAPGIRETITCRVEPSAGVDPLGYAKGGPRPSGPALREQDGNMRARTPAPGSRPLAASPGHGLWPWLLTVSKHRIQAFSRFYFRPGSGLFSYSRENCRAARARSDSAVPCPFFAAPLGEPSPEYRCLDINSLISFYSNPSRYLLTRRLGVSLPGREETPEDKEAFAIEGLEGYALSQAVIEGLQDGVDREECCAVLRGSGRLPHGTVGSCLFRKSAREIEAFISKLEPYRGSASAGPLPIDLAIGEYRVSGRFEQLRHEHQLFYRFAVLKPRDRLTAWIYHLALCATDQAALPRTTVVAARDGIWRIGPVESAVAMLGELLELYWKGLREPLHFFPRTSWAWVDTVIRKQKNREVGLAAATKEWVGDDRREGERVDLYYDLCFRGAEPIDAEFEEVAGKVYGPVVASFEGLRKR